VLPPSVALAVVIGGAVSGGAGVSARLWLFPRRLLARQRGAITQGRTREEARENLKDAIHMMLEVMREDAEKDLEGKDVTREYIEVQPSI
jgi:hypothetical protein